MNENVVEAHDLAKRFEVGGGFMKEPKLLHAVDGVDLVVRKGETFAIVGESGCGKSTLARLLMRLIEPTEGTIRIDGRDMSDVSGRDLRALRRDVQFIFQDPFSSLNPRLSVARLVGEPLEAHRPDMSAKQRRAEVARLLRQVGLRPEQMDRYPHEFSGGQRQRVGIARALASGPKVLIGDEPVSALDVSVQAQVVNLLSDLRETLDLTLIVIAHDLAVIRQMSDRVAVMYLGRIVETGPTDTIFETPRHPYTRALLSAIPGAVASEDREGLKGETPSPIDPPSGCHFRTRCPHAIDACAKARPPLEDAPGDAQVACIRWREIGASDVAEAEPPARTDGAKARFELYRKALESADNKVTENQQETTP
ncbi:ATP-binding cassette domain-containing protein [Paracoccus sp. TK19116]|uniref:ATP-binding cassette domain-containing protein n=1 Tax=Paracoccus albicereus TaxID=2922394 RepID=A0ABT1MS30_9RHOB|nr:oligopeptide/dipeptide ABC transporter ATP-binding protein [Paracoccus albicereus]MCQ0971115.1 ATP-binding cassette domain-containing protein [Paracoccus albicereus]